MFGLDFCLSPDNAIEGTYKKLVVSGDGRLLLGGILIGDASAYGNLLQLVQNQITLPPHPEDLLVPPREGATAPLLGVDNLPDTAQICSCNNVSKADLCNAIADGTTDLGNLKSCTKAVTGCGGCVPLVKDILTMELKKAGVEVKNHVCEHFEYSCQELFHLVKVNKIS